MNKYCDTVKQRKVIFVSYFCYLAYKFAKNIGLWKLKT